jgi:hypothetical protein
LASQFSKAKLSIERLDVCPMRQRHRWHLRHHGTNP